MKAISELDKILKKLVGHRVLLHYNHNTEGTMRESEGTLTSSTESIIQMILWDSTTGNKGILYINRHACSLLSIMDEGVAEKTEGGKHI